MSNCPSHSERSLPRSWRWFLIGAIAVGIGFRGYQLEGKVYWGDEVYTSMRISGYTAAEVREQLYTGEPLGMAEVMRYQRPNPEQGWKETFSALAGSPEHTPLYYILARFWVQFFGNDRIFASAPAYVWLIRSLSAIASLLAFPCLYWLCRELGGSDRVAEIAMGLFAVSPFHVLYAQEAREYALWTTSILLASAALLHALRKDTLRSWLLYALALGASLYCFLFSLLVAIAHGIYITAIASRRQQWRYLGATAIGGLLFLPWLAIAWLNRVQLQANVAHLSQERPDLPWYWLLNLSRIFFDFNHGASAINPLTYAMLALSLYAIYYLCRSAPQSVWLFVLTLIGATGIVLIGSDLVFGGLRSTIARYGIPCYLGIQLAVAYLFADRLPKGEAEAGKSKAWQRGAIALILLGVLSCSIHAHVPVWWNKSPFKTRHNPQIAEIVNREPDTIIISDSTVERVLALAYLLSDRVRLQLVPPGGELSLAKTSPPLYLYQPSESLRNWLGERYHCSSELVYKSWLWKLSGCDSNAEISHPRPSNRARIIARDRR